MHPPENLRASFTHAGVHVSRTHAQLKLTTCTPHATQEIKPQSVHIRGEKYTGNKEEISEKRGNRKKRKEEISHTQKVASDSSAREVLLIIIKSEYTPAVRSKISSKLIFASCV